jgi:hypothetical protein
MGIEKKLCLAPVGSHAIESPVENSQTLYYGIRHNEDPLGCYLRDFSLKGLHGPRSHMYNFRLDNTVHLIPPIPELENVTLTAGDFVDRKRGAEYMTPSAPLENE